MTMTEERRAVIDAIASDIVQLELGYPVRVAVDGITAVGKTTFSDQLADAVRVLDRPCARVSMDGFHNPRSTRYRQGRESPDGYYEDAYDFTSLRRELLDPLGAGGSLLYRTAIIDLAADVPLSAPPQPADPRLVLIVDGSFLQRSELDGAWDRTIFLRSNFESARARGVARDAEQLGSAAEAERIFKVRYHAAQQRYLSDVEPERRADIVIEHHDPHRPVIVTAGGSPRE
jgi:uridine kinase